MQDEEWDAWVERHVTVFGLRGPENLAMVNSWRQVFELARYDHWELMGTTDWLAAHAPPPGFAKEQLTAIRDRMRDLRARSYVREGSYEQEHGTCADCGGTGRIIVPHLGGVMGDTWVGFKVASLRPYRYTGAVLCRCPLGRRLGDTLDGHEMLCSLDRYERSNPHWRRQVADRRREEAEEARLSGPLSPPFAEVLRRVGRIAERQEEVEPE